MQQPEQRPRPAAFVIPSRERAVPLAEARRARRRGLAVLRRTDRPAWRDAP